MIDGLLEMTEAQLLAVIDAALDALTAQRPSLATGREQMDLLATSLRVSGRLEGWQAQLADRLENGLIVWQEYGTSTGSWLAEAGRMTRREAGRLIASGEGLRRFDLVGQATLAGDVLPVQARAITDVLAGLPTEFDTAELVQAQGLMVEFAATYNSGELRRLTTHLLEVMAPDQAEALAAAKVERDYRAAMRARHLTFRYDHAGRVDFHGSLPVVEAEPFIKIIDAYSAAAKRGLDRIDPADEFLTPGMRRADALLAMVHHHSQEALAPANGGDRPRIVVTMSYDKLLKTARDAGLLDGTGIGGFATDCHGASAAALGAKLLSTGEPIPAGLLRRMLCDADLLPAVLGGPSQPLDVGTDVRLATGAIRVALELRDKGCIFPGCDKPPSGCHAHHLKPWRQGGPTAVNNLVLVCPHHHGIVEPSDDPTADRWRAQLGPDGTPTVIPPRRVDPSQRPRQHLRYAKPQRR